MAEATWWTAFCAAKNAGHFEEAYYIALECPDADPRSFAARSNMAARLGLHEQALGFAAQAFERQPTNNQWQYNYALELLRNGRFAEGWALYEARLRLQGHFASEKHGRRVWLDQGVGDQILFASLIPDLPAKHYTFLCDPRLVALFSRSFPEHKFEGASSKPEFDCTMAWLAARHRLKFEDFPRKAYLVEPFVVKPTFNTGVAYHSYGTKDEKHKSIPRTLLEPFIVDLPGTAVNLQYLPDGMFWDDLDGLAAQAAQCKTVVTTSNVTAHMAGALGLKTCVLVPLGFGQMWHWFLDRKDSPWYPSVEIVRQELRGDWSPCLERAKVFVQEHTS